MTSPSGERPIDDALLVEYLLGTLSGKEAERLDEMSIADDEIAWRLRAVENDLVDKYVRNELSGTTLQQFKSSYLASPQRRQKVDFANALLGLGQRHAGASLDAPDRSAGVRTFPYWALAVAATAIAVVGAAYLFAENRRLREQVSQIRAERLAGEETAQGLRTALEQERSVSSAIRDELTRLRAALPSARVPTLGAFLLLPMRRGTDQIAEVSLPKGSDQAAFRLRLESDDYQSYEAALRDPATGQPMWKSGRLTAQPDGVFRYVQVVLPANLLRPQTYTFDLAGSRGSNRAEMVTSYAFRVVLQ